MLDLNNNFVLALISGVIAMIATFIKVRNNEEEKKVMTLSNYLNVFLLVSVLTVIFLFLKQYVFKGKPVMQSGGQPSVAQSVPVEGLQTIDLNEPKF